MPFEAWFWVPREFVKLSGLVVVLVVPNGLSQTAVVRDTPSEALLNGEASFRRNHQAGSR